MQRYGTPPPLPSVGATGYCVLHPSTLHASTSRALLLLPPCCCYCIPLPHPLRQRLCVLHVCEVSSTPPEPRRPRFHRGHQLLLSCRSGRLSDTCIEPSTATFSCASARVVSLLERRESTAYQIFFWLGLVRSMPYIPNSRRLSKTRPRLLLRVRQTSACPIKIAAPGADAEECVGRVYLYLCCVSTEPSVPSTANAMVSRANRRVYYLDASSKFFYPPPETAGPMPHRHSSKGQKSAVRPLNVAGDVYCPARRPSE